MSFETLGLTPELLRAVAAEGYIEPTPVQAEAIPFVLAKRDVLAGAQTGTGKTAAFVLPILQLLNANRPAARLPQHQRPKGSTGMPIRCLVLTPTRELALQVDEFVRTYGRERPIRSMTIYGGVGYEPQYRGIKAGPEIVVATPGRLLDIASQGKIDLRQVEILVLDEADRMLDMGFIRDIRRIFTLLPARRQNLLFSATFSDDIRSLAATILSDPAQVQIARRNAPIELVRQVIHPVDRTRKRELLSHLIQSGRIDRALVFTRTKHGANRLAEQLADDGISSAAIHGNKSQNQRVKALDSFKEGRVAILVATEVAARGIDIDGLPHVVNYELPTVAADYVHRIGRTGRAGVEGDAVSLVCVDEAGLLADIETLLRQPIARELVAGFEPTRGLRPEPIPELTRGGQRGRPMPRGAMPHRNQAHAAPRSAAQRRPWASGGPQGARPALGNRPAAGQRPANAQWQPGPRPGFNDQRPPYGTRPANGHRPPNGPRNSFESLPGERFARTSSSER